MPYAPRRASHLAWHIDLIPSMRGSCTRHPTLPLALEPKAALARVGLVSADDVAAGSCAASTGSAAHCRLATVLASSLKLTSGIQ